MAMRRGFRFYVCLLAGLVTASVAIGPVLISKEKDAAVMGFLLSFALQQEGITWDLVHMYTMAENSMVSVERVMEYIHLTPEASLKDNVCSKPPKDWPSSGEIVATNVNLRYDDGLPYVLHDVHFTIHGCEKVGVVGRTGAGKSSLITALFRLSELEGCVRIDGVDIQSIGLHDLRKSISVIPQDPVLFRGTLRRNLDPFNEFSDYNLWIVLQQVQMDDVIRKMAEGLECEVSECGANFSVGERQLICLARALLRKNRILILDEATANVDHRTDAVIQDSIRQNFRDCTVLTIAHRLQTVMDSDRLMVLDDGCIVEFDTPTSLLKDKNSFCHQMASRYGQQGLQNLLSIAEDSKRHTLAK